MEKFSDSRLKRIRHFGFPFFYKSANSAISEYNKEIQNGKMSFNRTILKLYRKNDAHTKNLVALYCKAIIFRCNKKLHKELYEKPLDSLLALSAISIPFFVPFVFFKIEFHFWDYLLTYLLTILFALILGFIIVPCLNFVTNFKIKVGSILTGFFNFILLFGACGTLYFFLDIPENILKAGILSAYALFYLIILYGMIHYIMELFIDAIYFSNKILLSDELIFESAYRLSLTDWGQAVRRRSLRQNTIEEIERLASLVEKDWSSHIFPGDEKTQKWKVETLSGIAAGIRKFKRHLIIPSLDTPKELEQQFKSIFEKILKHDIKGLIDEEVPAGRVRKKSKFAGVQSVLVAILPLIVSLVLKIYIPELENNQILHIGIIVSVFWLIICILLWLDPNLADKVATIKSVREMWKGDRGE